MLRICVLGFREDVGLGFGLWAEGLGWFERRSGSCQDFSWEGNTKMRLGRSK